MDLPMTQSRLAPILARGLLVLGAALLAMIAAKGIADPSGTAAGDGVMLTTPFSQTLFQVAVGGFPLGGALFALGSALSTRSLRPGLAFLATFLFAALAIRLLGVQEHGGLAQNFRPITGEAVIGTASLAVLLWLSGGSRTAAASA